MEETIKFFKEECSSLSSLLDENITPDDYDYIRKNTFLISWAKSPSKISSKKVKRFHYNITENNSINLYVTTDKITPYNNLIQALQSYYKALCAENETRILTKIILNYNIENIRLEKESMARDTYKTLLKNLMANITNSVDMDKINESLKSSKNTTMCSEIINDMKSENINTTKLESVLQTLTDKLSEETMTMDSITEMAQSIGRNLKPKNKQDQKDMINTFISYTSRLASQDPSNSNPEINLAIDALSMLNK